MEAEGTSSIRVQVSLLDSLMTLMGEMVLVRNQVLQFSSRSEDLGILGMSKRLNAVTNEIQSGIMKTRMQPIGNLLEKFHRVTRDLSGELGKKISLQLSGAETELDKSLLEDLKDSLTHIVLNSCDHGIEPPAERLAAGKPEAGTVSIKAFHESGQVIVEVADDGRGLRPETLVAKAVEKGLISREQAERLSEKEALGLIFAPGFSTAEKVTSVSGRGVGMDVVRVNIERVGGTIELSSTPGAGALIRLKIPLTLAIVPALLVRCRNATFAIPQVKLEELLRLDAGEGGVELLHGVPVYRLRGKVLPLVDLAVVLGLGSRPASNLVESALTIAVLQGEGGSFGVIIDEVRDTADIVVKPLTRLLKSLQVYSGATILGDGSVALILDVTGLSQVSRLGREKAAAPMRAPDADARAGESKDFLLVNLNSPTKHALPLGCVHRLEELQPSQVELSGGMRVVRYRGQVLPLVSANQVLGYGDPGARAGQIPVVVMRFEGRLFGIEVCSVSDTFSTNLPVLPSLRRQHGIAGNIGTSGELVVVLDPAALVGELLGRTGQDSERMAA